MRKSIKQLKAELESVKKKLSAQRKKEKKARASFKKEERALSSLELREEDLRDDIRQIAYEEKRKIAEAKAKRREAERQKIKKAAERKFTRIKNLEARIESAESCPDWKLVRGKDLIVYKKVDNVGDRIGSQVIKLFIPKEARKFQSQFESKCRTEAAYVIGPVSGSASKWKSNWDSDFIYKSGSWVFPFKLFSTEKRTCASGIHFYTTKTGAMNH